MQQQSRALQVSQEAVPQPGALGRPADQARHVGHHKAATVFHTHHTQIGVQRGERIVSHLRTGIGDLRDEGGLARVGHAQQAHVGQHLQLQLQPTLLARPARCGLARCPVGTALEMQVAQATVTALGQHHPLAMRGQVKEQLARVLVMDLRAHRHAQHDVVSALAVLVRAPAVLAAACLVLAGIAEVDQRVDVAIRLGQDGAAPAAIAAIGPTIRDELLAAKRRRPVAASPGDHLDPGLVDEFHGSLLPGKARTGLFLRLKPGTDPADLQRLHGHCPLRHPHSGRRHGQQNLAKITDNSKRLPSWRQAKKKPRKHRGLGVRRCALRQRLPAPG